MLACIPSAWDACEHDYSILQRNVPSMVEMSREYDGVVVGSFQHIAIRLAVQKVFKRHQQSTIRVLATLARSLHRRHTL
jgi:hypothetical protein